MSEGLRKGLALLSVLLLLAVFRCMATCIVSDSGFSAPPPSSAAVPPCHQHHVPAQEPRNSAPCQNHPGLLAYSVPPSAPHIDLPVITAAVYQSVTTPRERPGPRAGILSHKAPLARPALVLRI